MGRLTWDRLVDADYRLAALEQAARCVMAEAPDVYADLVYGQAKWAATALVGGGRGVRPIAPPDHANEAAVAARLAPVILLPAPAVVPQWMHEPSAFQVACVHLYDAICDVEDARRGWVA